MQLAISFMSISSTKLILIVSTFLTLFYNYTFFENVFKVYPIELKNIGFLFSLLLVLTFLNVLIFTLLNSKYIIKGALVITLLASSCTNYFMNTYHIIFDDTMIRNIVQTNLNESFDLLSIQQVIYFITLGIIPSVYIFKLNIQYKALRESIISKIQMIGVSLLVITICIFSFSKHYTSFVREHKPLRFSINPTYWTYSIGKYIYLSLNNQVVVLNPLGEDARIISNNSEKQAKQKKIVILVVGEAARADHFSLNGYKKETNPLLSTTDIVNFSDMYSCGTSTAQSLPCMFSIYTKEDYSYQKGIRTENVLDVLSHTNEVNILWRDNNSDSKGVALRVPYKDFKSAKNNTICRDGECRDEGMLIGLDSYIKDHDSKDILIVLHQMGNHGPAYYKRYPKSFEKFKPVCKTNQLEECTQEEITNAYDNAILYTDYFLSKTIDVLKKYDEDHAVAMIYMSDHGESLGENGMYLHGLPYFMAPDAQIHIGSLMWFGREFSKKFNPNTMKTISKSPLSQDNLFHTLLGVFDVNTKVYDKELDIMQQTKMNKN